MLDILGITGPIYIAIALGYAVTRAGLFSRADMRVLGKFVIHVALPAMLFNALSQRRIQEIVNGPYLLVYTLGSLLTLALGWAWARRGAGQDATTSVYYAMGMCCSNSGFVAFPIALLVIGPMAGVMLGLNMIVENLLVLPLLLALAEASTGQGGRWYVVLRQSLLALARNPMVLGLIAGFIVSWMGWRVPRRWTAASPCLRRPAPPCRCLPSGARWRGRAWPACGGPWRRLRRASCCCTPC